MNIIFEKIEHIRRINSWTIHLSRYNKVTSTPIKESDARKLIRLYNLQKYEKSETVIYKSL